jgi:hypothetical protein
MSPLRLYSVIYGCRFSFNCDLEIAQSVQRLGYGLDVRGSIPGRDYILSLCHRVQTDPVAQPASYPRGTGGSFPGGKAAGT